MVSPSMTRESLAPVPSDEVGAAITVDVRVGDGVDVDVDVAVSLATGVCTRTVFVVGTLSEGLSEPELEHAAPVQSTTNAVRRRSGFITNKHSDPARAEVTRGDKGYTCLLLCCAWGKTYCLVLVSVLLPY